MPNYLYQNPKTKEVIEVFQHMKDEHRYIKDGVEWARVFESPQAAIDTFGTLDPFDSKAFVKKTARIGMTVGDMWDESKRLSQKRENILGKDTVKEKTKADYKYRTGLDHPSND